MPDPKEIPYVTQPNTTDRYREDVLREQAGVPTATSSGSAPSFQEAFPFEQSAWADFGNSIYNTMVPENFGGIAQLTVGLGENLFKFFTPQDFHQDIDEMVSSWNDSIMDWKEDAKQRLSDRAMGVGIYEDNMMDTWTNKLASFTGGAIGFVGAMGIDALLTRGAASVLRVGKMAPSLGRVLTAEEMAAQNISASRVKKMVEYVLENEGRLVRKGIPKEVIERTKNMAIRTAEKNKMVQNALSKEEWGALSEAMSPKVLTKKIQNLSNITSIAGLTYGGAYDGAVAAGIDPKDRSAYALAVTAPMTALMSIPFGGAFNNFLRKGHSVAVRNAVKVATENAIKSGVESGSASKGLFFDYTGKASENFGKWYSGYLKSMLDYAAKTPITLSEEGLAKLPGHMFSGGSVMGLTTAVEALGQELYDKNFADSQAIVGQGKFGTELLSAETAKNIITSGIHGVGIGAMFGSLGLIGLKNKKVKHDLFSYIGQMAELKKKGEMESASKLSDMMTGTAEDMARKGVITEQDLESFYAEAKEMAGMYDNKLWSINGKKPQWQAYNLFKIKNRAKFLSEQIDAIKKDGGVESERLAESLIPDLKEIFHEEGSLQKLVSKLESGERVASKDADLAKLEQHISTLNEKLKGKFDIPIETDHIEWIKEAGESANKTFADQLKEDAPIKKFTQAARNAVSEFFDVLGVKEKPTAETLETTVKNIVSKDKSEAYETFGKMKEEGIFTEEEFDGVKSIIDKGYENGWTEKDISDLTSSISRKRTKKERTAPAGENVESVGTPSFWKEAKEAGIEITGKMRNYAKKIRESKTAESAANLFSEAIKGGKEQAGRFVDYLSRKEVIKPEDVDTIKTSLDKIYKSGKATAKGIKDLSYDIAKMAKEKYTKFSSKETEKKANVWKDIKKKFDFFQDIKGEPFPVQKEAKGNTLFDIRSKGSDSFTESLSESGINIPKSAKGKELSYLFNAAHSLLPNSKASELISSMKSSEATSKEAVQEIAKNISSKDLESLSSSLKSIESRKDMALDKLKKTGIDSGKKMGEVVSGKEWKDVELMYGDIIGDGKNLLETINSFTFDKEFKDLNEVSIGEFVNAMEGYSEGYKNFVETASKFETLKDIALLNEYSDIPNLGDRVIKSMTFNDLKHALNTYNKDMSEIDANFKKASSYADVKLSELKKIIEKRRKWTDEKVLNRGHYKTNTNDVLTEARGQNIGKIYGIKDTPARSRILKSIGLVNPKTGQVLGSKEVLSIANRIFKNTERDKKFFKQELKNNEEAYSKLASLITTYEVNQQDIFSFDSSGRRVVADGFGSEKIYVGGKEKNVSDIVLDLENKGHSFDDFYRGLKSAESRFLSEATAEDIVRPSRIAEAIDSNNVFSSIDQIPLSDINEITRVLSDQSLVKQSPIYALPEFGISMTEFTGSERINTDKKLLSFVKKYHPDKQFADSIKSIYDIDRKIFEEAKSGAKEASAEISKIKTLADVESGGYFEDFISSKEELVGNLYKKNPVLIRKMIEDTIGEVSSVGKPEIERALKSKEFQSKISRDMIEKFMKEPVKRTKKVDVKKDPTLQAYKDSPQLLKMETGLDSIDDLPRIALDYQEYRIRKQLANTKRELGSARSSLKEIKKSDPGAYKFFKEKQKVFLEYKKTSADRMRAQKFVDIPILQRTIRNLNSGLKKMEDVRKPEAISLINKYSKLLEIAKAEFKANSLAKSERNLNNNLSYIMGIPAKFDRVKQMERYNFAPAIKKMVTEKSFKETSSTLEDIPVDYLKSEFGVTSKAEVRDMIVSNVDPVYKDASWSDIPASAVMELKEVMDSSKGVWKIEDSVLMGEVKEPETIITNEQIAKELGELSKTFGEEAFSEFAEKGFGVKKELQRDTYRVPASERVSDSERESMKNISKSLLEKYDPTGATSRNSAAVIRSLGKFQETAKKLGTDKINGVDLNTYAAQLIDALKKDADGENVTIPFIRSVIIQESKDNTVKVKDIKELRQLEAHDATDVEKSAIAKAGIEKLHQMAMNEPYGDPNFILINGESLSDFVSKISKKTPEGREVIRKHEELMAMYDTNNKLYKDGLWEGSKAMYQDIKDSAPSAEVFGKMKDNPKLAERVIDAIKTVYPELDIKEVEAVFNAKGERKAGKYNSVLKLIEWASSDARLDNVPHEAAHHYIEMFRNHNDIVEAIEYTIKENKYENNEAGYRMAEEKLATYLGEKFTKELLKINNGEKTWAEAYKNPVFRIAAKIWNFLKNTFGGDHVASELMKIEEGFRKGKPAEPNPFMTRPEYYTGNSVETIKQSHPEVEENKLDMSNYTESGIEVKDIGDAIDKFGRTIGDNTKASLSKMLKNKDAFERIQRKLKGEKIELGKDENIAFKNIERLLIKRHHDNITKDSYFVAGEKIGAIDGADKAMENEVKRFNVWLQTMPPGKKAEIMKYMYGKFNINQSHLFNVSKLLSGGEHALAHKILAGGFDKGSSMSAKFNQEQLRILQKNIKATKDHSYYMNSDPKSIRELKGKELSIGGKQEYLSDAEAGQIYMLLRQDRNGIVDKKSTLILDVVDRIKERKSEKAFTLSKEEADGIVSYVEGNEQLMKNISSIDEALENSLKMVNDVHVALNGYKIPKRSKFFPVFRDIKAELEGSGIGSIEDLSFAKQRLGGDAPIRVGDMYSHYSAYHATAKNYYSYAVPIRNAKKMLGSKWFNDLKFSDLVGESGKQNIKDFISNQIAEIEDPQLLYRQLVSNKTFDKIIRNFPIAVLGYNVFTAPKQAVSYLMASSDMNRKYLYEAFKHIPDVSIKGFKTWGKDRGLKNLPEMTEDIKRISQYSDYLAERFKGAVNEEMGEVFHADINNLTGEDVATGYNVLGHRINAHPFLRTSRVMDWIKIVDSATITALWKAAEMEIKDMFPDLEPGSDAFYKAVANRTEGIVKKTQPTFDSVWRTGFRRKKDIFSKSMNMFTSQVTKNYNSAMGSIFDYYANGKTTSNKSKMNRNVMASFFWQPLLMGSVGTMQAAFYGIGDDEKIKGAASKTASYAAGNFFGGKLVYDFLSSGPKSSLEQNNPVGDIALGTADLLANMDKRSTTNNIYRMIHEGSPLVGIPRSPFSVGKAVINKL